MAARQARSRTSAAKPAAGKRVLAIDTDHAFLTAVRSMVETARCRVDLAGSAAEARAFITRHHYDLVISNLAMPEMDAAELCERLGDALVAGTRLLFLATTAPPAKVRAFLEEGHLTYLDKPVHLRRFLDKLDDLLRGAEPEEF